MRMMHTNMSEAPGKPFSKPPHLSDVMSRQGMGGAADMCNLQISDNVKACWEALCLVASCSMFLESAIFHG